MLIKGSGKPKVMVVSTGCRALQWVYRFKSRHWAMGEGDWGWTITTVEHWKADFQVQSRDTGSAEGSETCFGYCELTKSPGTWDLPHAWGQRDAATP